MLVLNANLHAINQKMAEFTQGKFDPTTGESWYRNYWQPVVDETARPAWDELKQKGWAGMAASIRAQLRGNLACGRKLCLMLQSLYIGTDYIIDLLCANVSARHVYTPLNAEYVARYFQIPLILSIPDECGKVFTRVHKV